jgi:hypothetical protein
LNLVSGNGLTKPADTGTRLIVSKRKKKKAENLLLDNTTPSRAGEGLLTAILENCTLQCYTSRHQKRDAAKG